MKIARIRTTKTRSGTVKQRIPTDEKSVDVLDIINPRVGVDILIRDDRKVIWVNVDGICRFRICGIPRLDVMEGGRKIAASPQRTPDLGGKKENTGS